MLKENTTNKIITVVLALIITIAAITVLYVNLSEEETTDETASDDTDGQDQTPPEPDDQDQTPPEPDETVILTVIFENQQNNYTLDDLKTSFTLSDGTGKYIKVGALPAVIFEGPFRFLGIEVTKILQEFNNLPENYSIKVSTSYNQIYNYKYEEIMGEVDIYNESGSITNETGGVSMILAYAEDGDYITVANGGPLKIVFIDTDKVTASNLWAKWVTSIEVFEG